MTTRFGLNPRSVRFRAAAWASAALALLVLVSALAINWLVTREVRSSADSVLLEQAQDRAQLLGSGAPPESLVNVIGHEVIAVVLDPTGQELAVSGTPEPEVLRDLPAGVQNIQLIVVEGEDSSDDSSEDNGPSDESPHQETLRAAVVVLDDGSRVIVGNEGEETAQTLNTVRAVLAIGSPAVALAGALILWLITGRALRPVYRMRNDLDRIVRADSGSVDGGRVGEPGTRDEVDDLAVTLNHVLDQLDRASAARRQFVADASHELKSPVANARALIETGGPSTTTLGELDRLEALIEDLLFLARHDEVVVGTPTEFDLDDVLFDEAERAAIRTEIRIDASGIQPARVRADREQVARAVRNLIENAVRHAGSTVRVAVEEADGLWVLIVGDDGPGIPAPDRERIFDRFARLESERSRGDGGTGLGLSIVEAIAIGNGGRVSVADHDGPGARLELALPQVD